MTILSKLLVALGLDAGDFKAGLNEAEKATSAATADIGRKLSSIGDDMMDVGKKLTTHLTLPLAAIGGIAVKAASDLSESMNKVSVVFDDSAESIVAWSKDAAKSLGMSQQKALEAAGTFGNLLTALGMSSTEAAGMSTSIVELAADLASFNNIDPTEALEKLRAGLVGEAEPLRTLGVNLTEAAVQLKAMEMGLADTAAELTAQDKVQARYALILEQTASAQGDFARTSDGLANSMRIAKAELSDAAAALGTQLLPYATDAVGVVSDLVAKFVALPEPVKGTIVAIGGIAAAAGPATTALGALAKAGSLLFSPGGLLVTGAAAVVLGIIALNEHLGALEQRAQDAAAEILATSESYTEYRARAEDADLGSEIVSEGLYDVYKAAQDAGSAIEALEFQEAVDSVHDLVEELYQTQWDAQAAGIETTAGALVYFETQLRNSIYAASDLELEIFANADEMRLLGEYLGLTGDGLAEFVTLTTEAAHTGQELAMAEDYERRVEALRLLTLEDVNDATKTLGQETENAASTVWSFTGALEQSVAAAAGAAGGFDIVTSSATDLAAAISGMAGTVGPELDKLIDKWGDLTAAERDAMELEMAQTLLAEAQGMLAAGQITAGQFAQLWGAMATQFGSLVDPAQATTSAIQTMFAQWASSAGVTATEIATAVGNMGLTIDQAVADAQEAETAYIARFGGAGGAVDGLASKLVTLGTRISEIPEAKPIAFAVTGLEGVVGKVEDVASALDSIPTEVDVHVNIVLTGNPNILPQSPHTMMEYALTNLAKTADKLFPLTVGMEASGMVPELAAAHQLTPVAYGGAAAGGAGAGGGDTFVIHNHNPLATALNQAWMEDRRRSRLNGRM